jgi:hypothetical protein
MEAFKELLPVLLTALVGAAVPMVGAAYFAFKAKAEMDGVRDWKDYLIEVVDSVADEFEDEDEDEKPEA